MGLTLSMTGQVRDRVDCFKRKWRRMWYGIQNAPQSAVLLWAGLHLRSVCWDCARASLETGRFEGQALSSGPGARTVWKCAAEKLIAHGVLCQSCVRLVIYGVQRICVTGSWALRYRQWVVRPVTMSSGVCLCATRKYIGCTKAGWQRWVGNCVERHGDFYISSSLPSSECHWTQLRHIEVYLLSVTKQWELNKNETVNSVENWKQNSPWINVRNDCQLLLCNIS